MCTFLCHYRIRYLDRCKALHNRSAQEEARPFSSLFTFYKTTMIDGVETNQRGDRRDLRCDYVIIKFLEGPIII